MKPCELNKNILIEIFEYNRFKKKAKLDSTWKSVGDNESNDICLNKYLIKFFKNQQTFK